MRAPWKGAAIVLGLLALGTGSCLQGSLSFGSARYLHEVRLGDLPSGKSVLVASETVKVARGGQYARFDVLDSQTGKRTHRLAPWFWNAEAERLDYLGGAGTRQWWTNHDGRGVVLIDFDAGETIADEHKLLSANPALRGEMHVPKQGRFPVDPSSGALVAQGGDGHLYAIDINTLKAAPFTGALPRSVAIANVPRGAGSLVRPCRTITQGPCGAEWRSESGEPRWKLTTEDLHGDSVLAAEAYDDHTVYLYVADDTLLGTLMGGVFLCAVELESGRIRWRVKL